jgi:hypothetical protein
LHPLPEIVQRNRSSVVTGDERQSLAEKRKTKRGGHQSNIHSDTFMHAYASQRWSELITITKLIDDGIRRND